MAKLQVIIPMAGRGSRFKEKASQNAEYNKPKPLITVLGKPMVWWAVTSLPFVNLKGRPAKTKLKVDACNLIFIVLQEHEDNFDVSKHLQELFGTEITIILIPEVTRGAAETVLAAQDKLKADDAIIILDSDNYFDGAPLTKLIEKKTADVVGIIPVFTPPTQEPKFSYALVNEKNEVVQVGEKDPQLAAQGAPAILGGYYFSQWKIFKDEVSKMILNNELFGAQNKQEFYIAPIYQKLLHQGKKVVAAPLKMVKAIGTPDELEKFLAEHKS